MASRAAATWVRKFALLTPEMTVSEARQRLLGQPRAEFVLKPYGVIVDAAGAPLAYVDARTLEAWPGTSTLDAQREQWPTRCVLPEAEAVSVGAVARFFQDELSKDRRLPGIILVDAKGRPSAIWPRWVLVEALAGRQRRRFLTEGGYEYPRPRLIGPTRELGGTALPSEHELMVTRYGRLQFPTQVALQQRCALTVTIRREQVPGASGQVELGLTVREWPLKVVASLVGVRAEDFMVEGPSSGVIEVPRQSDSEPLTFTLVPQSLGEKKVRVRFEQDNTYLNTAMLTTEVVAVPAAHPEDAEVSHPPAITAKGQPPDLTIYVEESADRQYEVRVRTRSDDTKDPPRPVDQIKYKKPPADYYADIFDDLNLKTKEGLQPGEFDDAVRKIGSHLYDELFRKDGFKAFYWDEMSRLPKAATVQIVSDDPYFPWEILRPWRKKADGSPEHDHPEYLCQRFALSRWLAGPSPGSRLPLLGAVLVAPKSSLTYVQKEVDAIQELPGLEVQPIIKDKASLDKFLKSGQAQVVHFACHGGFELDNPDRSVIILDDKQLKPSELTADWVYFARCQPLVFVNACESGQTGVGLTGPDGWAKAFLEAGAGFFIGSVWKATDELACEFAKTFYERLWAGDSIAEAVRQARTAAVKSGDATYLSYTLYGNPCIRAVRQVG